MHLYAYFLLLSLAIPTNVKFLYVVCLFFGCCTTYNYALVNEGAVS